MAVESVASRRAPETRKVVEREESGRERNAAEESKEPRAEESRGDPRRSLAQA